MKPFMARAMKPFLDARDGCKARKRWQMEEEPEKPAEDNVQKKVGNMELKARLQALAEWIEEPEKPTQDNVQKKINMELAARLQALVEWIKEQQKPAGDTEQEKVECARQQMQAWMRSSVECRRRWQCGVADACMAGLAEAGGNMEVAHGGGNMEVAKLNKGQWKRLSRKLSRKLTDGRGAAEEEAGR